MSKAEDIYLDLFLDGRLRNCSNKDAFLYGYRQAEKELIDKAIRWIKEINTHHLIMRYSDSCEPPLSELTEWFKNYMKEENINSK